MIKHSLSRFLFILLVVLFAQATLANQKPKPPTIKDLGNNRYQVGNIVIDKSKQLFTISGVVIRNEPPIEFIAVTKGGEKAYESLLEMDTNAFDFNLACILIGLDEKKGKGSPMHFSPEAVKGDKVDVTLFWTKDNKTKSIAIADLLESETGNNIPSDWVYTASSFNKNGDFLAHLDGTLIGFVHSINTIIEHRTGIGLGNYGGINISANLPPVGSRISLQIKKAK